jgi:high-affinity nickel-transport protein
MHFPSWAQNVGAWISAAILMLLSGLNLAQLKRSNESHRLQPVGLLGRLLERFAKTRHPAAVALLGALFALSFDTLSQALLFSATAVKFQGWISALVLAVLFTLGMTLLDGLNGVWLARLLRTADRTGMSIARAVGAGVSVLGMLVAATGMARLLSARVDSIIQAQEAFYGVAFVALLVVIPVLLVKWPKHRVSPPLLHAPHGQ